MKIIAFTGMPWSGKSEAVRLAKEQGIPVIRMGDFIWEETKQRGLDLVDGNVGKIATEMRNTHGKDIWAQKTYEAIQQIKNDHMIIIDGVRNLEEVEYFKQHLSTDFSLVAIDAQDQTRHQRALQRNRQDDEQDIGKLKERDKRELGWGLGEVIASADIVISNEDGIEPFQQQIITLFQQLMKR